MRPGVCLSSVAAGWWFQNKLCYTHRMSLHPNESSHDSWVPSFFWKQHHILNTQKLCHHNGLGACVWNKIVWLTHIRSDPSTHILKPRELNFSLHFEHSRFWAWTKFVCLANLWTTIVFPQTPHWTCLSFLSWVRFMCVLRTVTIFLQIGHSVRSLRCRARWRSSEFL